MNSVFRKALTINEICSVDTILKRFRPTVGMNEGDPEALTKTLKSTSQMPVTRETDEIIIDLNDERNIHITEFNQSYFEIYFNIYIDMFQGRFPILPTNTAPAWLNNTGHWTNCNTIPAYSFLFFFYFSKFSYILILPKKVLNLRIVI
jgi:hypothetical protein